MHALASARRYDKRVAVLYLDLDGFKEVNDTHGHGAGDVLLQQVAQRLQRCVRAEDTVARLGGDEFGIVLAQLSGAEDCRLVACKIIQALSEPFHHGGVAACISASVGGALYPDHGTELNTLIAHADSAMYAAKMAGKNRFSQEPPPRTDIGSGG